MTKLKNIPSWNLTDFYSSTKDKKISADLKIIEKEIKNFVRLYRDEVTIISASELFNAIKKYEEISEKIGKISAYSYLVYASDLSNQANISFYQNISEALSKLESELVFFTLELNRINDKEIKKLLKNSKLKKYQPFIRDSRIFKKYQLSHELKNSHWKKILPAEMPSCDYSMKR